MIPWKPRGVRRSLWITLVVLVIVAVPVALWSAAEKLKEYRAARGYLRISDPALVHAAAMPAQGPLHWRWRLYLPPGRNFVWHAACCGIRATGIPELPADRRDYQLPLGSDLLPRDGGAGEYVLDVAIRKNATEGWLLALQNKTGTSSLALEPQDSLWIRLISNQDRDSPQDYGYSSAGLAERTTESVAPGEPLVLLRLRVDIARSRETGGVRQASSAAPCDGLVLWISAGSAPAETGGK